MSEYKPTITDLQNLAGSKALAYTLDDLREIYKSMWADCQDKKEREYYWFKQNAIAEIKHEIESRASK